MRRLAWLAATSVLGLALPGAAHAYCTTRVDSARARTEGVVGEDGCYGSGPNLHWKNRCISYQIYNQIVHFSQQEAQQVVAEAFAKWTQTSCETAEGGDARISIDVRYLGFTACAAAGRSMAKDGKPGIVPNGPNQNAIAFRDASWPYKSSDDGLDDPSRTLGLTTVTYNDKTGEIVDADMEINSFDAPVKIRDITFDDYDLASIVTHEVGHFLGLAHSEDPNATMYAEHSRGDVGKQFLKPDDIRAICSVYLPGGQRATGSGALVEPGPCDPTPRGGVQSVCDEGAGGCSLSTGSPTSLSAYPLLALCALGALGRLRRRP